MPTMAQLQLYDPHPSQQLLIDACLDPTIYCIVAVIGRKWGKTIAAENMALYLAFNNPGSTIYWVCPTDGQSLESYTHILNALADTGLVEDKRKPKGGIEMIFPNKSRIMFKSAASEDNLRGADVDYMILDEAAFIKRTTVEAILEPMMLVKGKKLLILSTPKGKNWLYDYYRDGLDPSKPDCISFSFPSWDNPYVTSRMIDRYRDRMPTKIFEQEIEAKFVDGAAIFNNINELMCLDKIKEPMLGESYWAGIDVGLINDATVLSIVDSNGFLVGFERWSKVEAPDLILKIIKLNDKWKFRKILIEGNNQGLPIFQELYRKIGNIDTFTTTNKSKSEIINELVYAFNMREIKLVKDDYLRIELEAFIFEQNELGTMKFMADSGFHDDCVISLAIARYCWKYNKFDMNYFGIFY